MRKTSIAVTLAALLIMACAMGSHAAQIVQDSTLLSVPSGGTLDFNVLGFNTNLGTLNSVTIDLSTTVSGPWSVTKDSQSPMVVTTSGSASGYTTATYNLSPSISGVANANDSQGWNTTLANNGDSVSGNLNGADAETFNYTKGSTNLSPFDSSWNVAIANGSTFVEHNRPGLAVGNIDITGTSEAKVIYNYTPTPEPASLLVLLAGGAGMLGMVKRRRA